MRAQVRQVMFAMLGTYKPAWKRARWPVIESSYHVGMSEGKCFRALLFCGNQHSAFSPCGVCYLYLPLLGTQDGIIVISLVANLLCSTLCYKRAFGRWILFKNVRNIHWGSLSLSLSLILKTMQQDYIKQFFRS